MEYDTAARRVGAFVIPKGSLDLLYHRRGAPRATYTTVNSVGVYVCVRMSVCVCVLCLT